MKKKVFREHRGICVCRSRHIIEHLKRKDYRNRQHRVRFNVFRPVEISKVIHKNGHKRLNCRENKLANPGLHLKLESISNIILLVSCSIVHFCCCFEHFICVRQSD